MWPYLKQSLSKGMWLSEAMERLPQKALVEVLKKRRQLFSEVSIYYGELGEAEAKVESQRRLR